MIEYLSALVSTTTNYKLQNITNLYNCFYDILDKSDDPKKIINSIKVNIGLSFIEELRLYIYRKIPSSEILKCFD